MEQQRLLYTNNAARCLAQRIKRGCDRFLASLLCTRALATASQKANLALGHDSDDGLFRSDELDLSHGLSERFTGEHDMASKSCTGLGVDRRCSVFPRTNDTPRLGHDDHMCRRSSVHHYDGVYVRRKGIRARVVVSRSSGCVRPLLRRCDHEHEGTASA